MIKKTFYLLTLILIGLAPLSAQANHPVVVEMFGMNGCGADMKVQDSVFQLLREHEDIIFINCRKKFDMDDAEMKYTHQFCNDRSAEYARRHSFWGERTPTVMVNGKWEAFYNDINPAIKVGRTDKVQPIDLSIEDEAIHISVPKIEDVENGSLFIYSYTPTQGDETLVVDSDVDLTDDIQERLAAGQSVPFVTKERLVPYYVRPVINRVKIAQWTQGQMFQASFPLDMIAEIENGLTPDLSYIVILHKDDDYGQVIAAGEMMATAEQNNVLLHSKAPDIELRSQPNPNVIKDIQDQAQ